MNASDDPDLRAGSPRAGGPRSRRRSAAAVRSSTPYARMVAAPTTDSDTAPSRSPTRSRTSGVGRARPSPLEAAQRRGTAARSRARRRTVSSGRVDDHQDRRDGELRDATRCSMSPPNCTNMRDRVDVAGDPGDQRAAPLGVLGQHRQVVDVPERLDPQRRQAALGGAEQPHVDDVRRDGRHGDGDRGDEDEPQHDAGVRPDRRRRGCRGRWSAGRRTGRRPGPGSTTSASASVTPMPRRSSGDSSSPRRSVAQVPSRSLLSMPLVVAGAVLMPAPPRRRRSWCPRRRPPPPARPPRGRRR